MNISINSYNLCACGYKPYDHMQRAGWNNLSIAYQVQEFDALAGDHWKDYILSIKEEFDSRGMHCVQTHLPYYNLLRDSSESDEATDRVLERGVILCSMLGAKWGAFHCRTAIKKGDSQEANEQSLRDNLALLKRLQKFAREYGVGIAIENLPDFYPGVPVHLFATDYHDVIRLADELADPEHFGVCWDFGHAHMNHVDQVQALREVGSRLKATHIHSNAGFNDDHLPISLGTINWDEMMRTLAEIGYNESLSMETLWPGDKVCGCTFEMTGFTQSMEQFADSYFTHNYQCAMILLEKLHAFRAK
ncbi:MAG TPA: hypothetical protein DD640_09810 [Clostridiales bacterium]|nr:hypothetical protein [Clostridiales bacterium]